MAEYEYASAWHFFLKYHTYRLIDVKEELGKFWRFQAVFSCEEDKSFDLLFMVITNDFNYAKKELMSKANMTENEVEAMRKNTLYLYELKQKDGHFLPYSK